MKTKILSPLRRDGYKAGMTIIAVLALSAALTVLTACSSDDSPIDNVEQRVPVTLAYSTIDATETRAAQGVNGMTRAAQNLNEGTFDSDESVNVRISNTGAGEWTDYTFTTGSAGTMTAPTPAPYYPAGSQNIDIVAYYPATAGTTFTVAADQTADASYKASDLMFASVNNQAKQAEAVNLAFSHKMAKLCVNITAGAGVGSITSVSILNVKPTVSFNQATGEVGEASGDATSIAVSNNGAALIPAQTIDGGLLSIVTDKGTATYSVASKAFAAGQLYTLNITVNLRAVGTTTAITGWTSEGTVTVNPVVELTNAPAGAEAVDLGLSVKWANMNVGATTETGYGTYFAWGETSGYTEGSTTGKTYYSWPSYTFGYYNGSSLKFKKYCSTSSSSSWFSDDVPVDNMTQLELGDDAARANWGGSWRMPTKTEFDELENSSNCNWEWTDDYNGTGIAGYIVTSKKTGYTGNSIFLPAAGQRNLGTTEDGGTSGSYWTSALYPYGVSLYAYYMSIDKSYYYTRGGAGGGHSRAIGLSVRAVTE